MCDVVTVKLFKVKNGVLTDLIKSIFYKFSQSDLFNKNIALFSLGWWAHKKISIGQSTASNSLLQVLISSSNWLLDIGPHILDACRGHIRVNTHWVTLYIFLPLQPYYRYHILKCSPIKCIPMIPVLRHYQLIVIRRFLKSQTIFMFNQNFRVDHKNLWN